MSFNPKTIRTLKTLFLGTSRKYVRIKIIKYILNTKKTPNGVQLFILVFDSKC